jgi:subtilisin-like proprotein convertase family protein
VVPSRVGVAGDGRRRGPETPGDAAFDGIDASGRWRLIVTDDNASDTGTLNDWSLRILY